MDLNLESLVVKLAHAVLTVPLYRRLLTISAGILAAAVLLTWLLPLIEQPTDREILSTSQAARSAYQEGRVTGLYNVTVPLTPLTAARIPVKDRDIFAIRNAVTLRWDNVVLTIGAIFIAILLAREIARSASRVQRLSYITPSTQMPSASVEPDIEPSEGDHSGPSGESQWPQLLPTPQAQTQAPKESDRLEQPGPKEQSVFPIHPESPAEAVLSSDVQRAFELATGLYARSTLLLAGGVLMSFVGIGVFWASLPAVERVPGSVVEALAAYVRTAIRPLAMLIFVEAISWFLLRQYRALIEDYKTFYRTYLRRVNFLAALKIATNPNVSSSELSIAAALLSDDLSGRVRSGETTEQIEAIKQIEPNPVVELFATIINRSADVAAEAAKSATRPSAK